LGGTFNPVHIGHLILAEETREKLSLDKIVFVPANMPPHKDTNDIAPSKDRFKMLKMATAGNKNLLVSNIEIKRKGRSYTIDTIKELSRLYKNEELYFIIGSDLLSYLDEWKDLSQITKMVRFIVARRPGYALEDIPHYIETLEIRAVDVSAFEIRERIKKNKSYRYLVPERVFEYINKNSLYR
jgi:nicotinate-nucleotide adenylyltransferase